MAAAWWPPALVTVLTLRPYGGVDLERFEVPYATRPMYIDQKQVYSLETHPADRAISMMLRSNAVDVATWLHRAGAWDQLPQDRKER